MLKVKINAKGVEAALRDLQRDMFMGSELKDAVNSATTLYIEKRLKSLFSTRFKSKKRHFSSFSGRSKRIPFQIAAEIVKNITTSTYKSTTGVISAVGDMSFMDRHDPIFMLNNPRRIIKSQFVRLWRLIEYGSIGPRYLAPRSTNLLKFPQSINSKIVNVNGRAVAFKPMQWKSPAGRWVIRYKPITNHPGHAGKGYVNKLMSTTSYTSKGPLLKSIFGVLRSIFKRYSYK